MFAGNMDQKPILGFEGDGIDNLADTENDLSQWNDADLIAAAGTILKPHEP